MQTDKCTTSSENILINVTTQALQKICLFACVLYSYSVWTYQGHHTHLKPRPQVRKLLATAFVDACSQNVMP